MYCVMRPVLTAASRICSDAHTIEADTILSTMHPVSVSDNLWSYGDEFCRSTDHVTEIKFKIKKSEFYCYKINI